MAVLQDTDNFIVSAGAGQGDAGTNYRISYADLLAKIQADTPSTGGGAAGAEVLGHGYARVQGLPSAITVPAGTTAVLLNGAASAGGAGQMAGPVWVQSLAGTSATIGTKNQSGGWTELSWTAFGTTP